MQIFPSELVHKEPTHIKVSILRSCLNHSFMLCPCQVGCKTALSFLSVPHYAEEDITVSKTTVIDYEDSDGKGTVTLVANPFENGGKFYAKFDRTTVNIDHLIARIQKKEVGTNAIMAKHMASLFKAEILEALSRGEAVNVLDLGTLYIKTNGTIKGDTPETASIPGFQVKFTCSKVTNNAVSALGIKKIVMSATTPVIGTMTDLFTDEETSEFTAGKAVRIEGDRLKVMGDEGGVFFAPATDKGIPVADEGQWIKVDKLIHNRSKVLEFFLPASLVSDTPYCIVIKTNSTKGNTTRKSYSVVSSGIVTVTD